MRGETSPKKFEKNFSLLKIPYTIGICPKIAQIPDFDNLYTPLSLTNCQSVSEQKHLTTTPGDVTSTQSQGKTGLWPLCVGQPTFCQHTELYRVNYCGLLQPSGITIAQVQPRLYMWHIQHPVSPGKQNYFWPCCPGHQAEPYKNLTSPRSGTCILSKLWKGGSCT